MALSVRGRTFSIFAGASTKVLFNGLAFTRFGFSGFSARHAVCALCRRLCAGFTLRFYDFLSIFLICFFVIGGRFGQVSGRGVVMYTAGRLGTDP